ncbi:hypothetical protein BH11MYX4_BH11MYX4_38810 [soil metagenome]
MTDLELLNAELERQNLELETCFEQMRSLDPELVIAVSPEWMSELSAEPKATPAPPLAPWCTRA